MTDRTIIGQRIAELRKNAGMTQAELAERLGVSHQAVSQWERNETLPDILTLPEIASVFGESITHLLGLPETPPENSTPMPACTEDIPSTIQIPITDSSYTIVLEKDGKKVESIPVELLKAVQIILHGSCQDISSVFSLQVDGNVQGNCNAAGSCQICGSVLGNFNSSGSGCVEGDVKGCCNTSGIMELNGDIYGDCTVAGSCTVNGEIAGDINGENKCTITANSCIAGDISCGILTANGDIGGDVACQGDMEVAGNIGGDVASRKNITVQGDVGGELTAGGDVTIGGSIAGDVTCGGDLQVNGDIHGTVE